MINTLTNIYVLSYNAYIEKLLYEIFYCTTSKLNSARRKMEKNTESTKTNWQSHKKFYITLIVATSIAMIFGIAAIIDGARGIKTISDFLTNQLLGMKWLNSLIGSALGGIFGTQFLAKWYGGSIQFFFYDVIKIIILLCFLIFLISYIQSYYPPERTKKILSRFKGLKGNALGALLGTVTPFCSCSSIPLFIGFTRAGVRSGATFSFLISSPLVDLGAFILLASIFGFPIAIVYVVVGLILAIIGGTIIEKTGAGKYVEEFVLNGEDINLESKTLTKKDRLTYAKEQMLSTFKKVFPYILIGVGIGALIHNVIPKEWIQKILGNENPFSVLIACAVGVPMYADIFGTIPVAEALFSKGVGVGTILAFMMSVTALSLPSLIMLRKAVKPKLLFTFIAVVTVGIIIIGYAFNAMNFLFI